MNIIQSWINSTASRLLNIKRVGAVINKAKKDPSSEIHFLAEMDYKDAETWIFRAWKAADKAIQVNSLHDNFSDEEKCLAYQRMIKQSQ